MIAAPLFLALEGAVSPQMFSHASATSNTSTEPLFRNFNGVVYLPVPEISKQLGIGWAREPFNWTLIEPKKGVWNWAQTDQKVNGAEVEGVQILPLLAYNASWDVYAGANGVSPPKDVGAWKEFVEHVVSRYSNPPYNLRYFQIWNEPTKQAGFWTGTDQQFVDTVYLPAAEIIRRHHCYVVFGGWPQSNSLQEFDSVLAYHDAWRWTDILDVHYRDAAAWHYLYNKWVKTGKCRGIWQTEVGYTAAPNALPALYLPSLAFALSKGMTNPDAFKLFWYAWWGAGPDAPKCLVAAPNNLTQHGHRLKVLNDLLGAGPLSSYTQFSTQPRLSTETVNGIDSVYGFQVGPNRTVVALIFEKVHFASIPMVNVTLSLPKRPGSVSMVTVTGERRTPQSRFTGSQLQVEVPVKLLGSDCPACVNTVGYIEADY